MKALSIWNPYALLLARGHKRIETRSWSAPSSVIGTRLAIASTKVIRSEQRDAFSDRRFRFYYNRLGLPITLEEMPNGYILGTVLLESCEEMTPDKIAAVREKSVCMANTPPDGSSGDASTLAHWQNRSLVAALKAYGACQWMS